MPADTTDRSENINEILKFSTALDSLETKFRKFNFKEGIQQVQQIKKAADRFKKNFGQRRSHSRISYLRDSLEILSNNLSRIANILANADEESRKHSDRAAKESRIFEKKFELIKQLQKTKNKIAALEEEKDAFDKNTEVLKFEEKFKILQKIQEVKAVASALKKEKFDIEQKGNHATPAELARKLDIVAEILKLNRSAAAFEEEISSLDAKVKSHILQNKLKIIEEIQKIKDAAKGLEKEISAIDAESSEETKKQERVRQQSSEIILKNNQLLDILAARIKAAEKDFAEPDAPCKEKELRFCELGSYIRDLIKKLNLLGCEECVGQILSLHECFSLFKEILSERINPEIGAFGRYFLRGAALYDTILNEFESIVTYLRAAGANSEQEMADRLHLLNLKENKNPKEYDEIFELTPRFARIQEARAKVSKKTRKIKKAIEMIREETLRITLREGYQTNFDLARIRFKELASKKSKNRVSLEVAMKNFEETCGLNKRILDRFEEQSIQHRRHRGN